MGVVQPHTQELSDSIERDILGNIFTENVLMYDADDDDKKKNNDTDM